MSIRVTKTTALLLAILLVSGTFLSAASGKPKARQAPNTATALRRTVRR